MTHPHRLRWRSFTALDSRKAIDSLGKLYYCWRASARGALDIGPHTWEDPTGFCRLASILWASQQVAATAVERAEGPWKVRRSISLTNSSPAQARAYGGDEHG